jgi:hypothetical protein
MVASQSSINSICLIVKYISELESRGATSTERLHTVAFSGLAKFILPCIYHVMLNLSRPISSTKNTRRLATFRHAIQAPEVSRFFFENCAEKIYFDNSSEEVGVSLRRTW